MRGPLDIDVGELRRIRAALPRSAVHSHYLNERTKVSPMKTSMLSISAPDTAASGLGIASKAVKPVRGAKLKKARRAKPSKRPGTKVRKWAGTLEQLEARVLLEVRRLATTGVTGNTKTLVPHLRAAGIAASNVVLGRAFAALLRDGRLQCVRRGKHGSHLEPRPEIVDTTLTPSPNAAPTVEEIHVSDAVIDAIAARVAVHVVEALRSMRRELRLA